MYYDSNKGKKQEESQALFPAANAPRREREGEGEDDDEKKRRDGAAKKDSF